MEHVATALVALVAIEHLYFLVLEMFLWTKPATRKAFGITQEEAETSKTLAANQGLYNGFLSAGLIWGLLHSNPDFALQIQTFFLACVLVAGIYGAATAKKTILFIQGGPALAALCALYFL